MLTRLTSVFATAARSVSAAPAYSITVIATLSVAIGAAATLVAITDAVVLRPLPFAAPHELVTLWESNPQAGYPKFRVAAGNFVDWSADHETFAGMALFGSSMRHLSGDGEPEQLLGGAVSGLDFNVLGVRPQLGRVLHVSDAQPGAVPVAVISDALWARRYGRRGDVIGRLMRLDGIAYTIVGVAPRGIYPTWPRTTGGIEWGARYQDLLDSTRRRPSAGRGTARSRLRGRRPPSARHDPRTGATRSRRDCRAAGARSAGDQHERRSAGDAAVR